MTALTKYFCLLFLVWTVRGSAAPPSLVFETTSPYHHIRVVDQAGLRTLYFDDSPETQMSLRDPLAGHFEYTEYFHLAWLWNTQLTSVVMIGLGGGSAQRSFEHYYPGVTVQSVEIDPMVLQVARDYFNFKESDRQRVQLSDGRVFLRRSSGRHDLIILDAYVQGRYGACIPQHLATKEFFELVRDHLSTNGIVAYNVIGSIRDWHAGIVGAVYRTLNSVFPQVYLFPAKTSRNVVLLATRATIKADLNALRQRAALLTQSGSIKLPGFRERLEQFQAYAPPSAASSPILTDDFAPVEGLVGTAEK
jgi:spermidine synthase